MFMCDLTASSIAPVLERCFSSAEQKNQPGNWIMAQNTPQAMEKDVLGTFMPHPGVIPGPGGSENGWFWG